MLLFAPGGAWIGTVASTSIVEVAAVYVRVVRFSDVSAERIEGLRARIEESDGPPPGVPTTGLKVLYDGEQGTAVVLQSFASSCSPQPAVSSPG